MTTAKFTNMTWTRLIFGLSKVFSKDKQLAKWLVTISEQVRILASCCLRLVKRNLV